MREHIITRTLADFFKVLEKKQCTVIGGVVFTERAYFVDRFIAITRPIRYAKHRKSRGRVYATLAVTWVVSAAISSPIALGMNHNERRLRTPHICTFYNSDFLIFSSMGSFYIPCVVMLTLYWRMFRTIRQRAREAVLRKRSLGAVNVGSVSAAAAIAAAATCGLGDRRQVRNASTLR